MNLPEELIRTPNPSDQWLPTGSPLVLKPTFGSLGSQYVRFYVHSEYSGADSEARGEEVRREYEICEITNDKFNKCAILVKDLSPRQKIELAPLYERFRAQKDSTDTQIVEWDAASDGEKGHLLMTGVHTVEQLNSYTDDDLYKLGVDGKDLRERARRHCKTKYKHKEQPDNSAELALLRQEKEELAERLKRLEEQYFASQLEKANADAAVKGAPSRPRKQEIAHA